MSIVKNRKAFDVDVSKLGDSELMVRDVNEIVRQMKAHIEKCGL